MEHISPDPSESKRNTGRTRTFIPLTLSLLLVAAGGAFWQFSKDPSKPPIVFPPVACGGVAKGKTLSSLFPKSGDPYWESGKDFAQMEAQDSCLVSAGGFQVEFNLHGYPPGGSVSENWVQKEVRSSTSTKKTIFFGNAIGYANRESSRLYADCKRQGRSLRVITVWVNYYNVPEERIPDGKREIFAKLAAEGLAYAAGPEGLDCEEGKDLANATLSTG
ncbi:hypothetical protein GCM10010406_29020 [Streptomyces thermolineatus]|uniref:Secreted protein n=1 Tax=Streptomyces thermolineatus TaxID=44033 RepID=A0ABN3LXT7_9ACTN